MSDFRTTATPLPFVPAQLPREQYANRNAPPTPRTPTHHYIDSFHPSQLYAMGILNIKLQDAGEDGVKIVQPFLRDQLYNTNKDYHTCGICFDDIEKKEDIIILSCGHHFCDSCLVSLRTHKCPFCKRPF